MILSEIIPLVFSFDDFSGFIEGQVAWNGQALVGYAADV